jgi:hypothetical protein
VIIIAEHRTSEKKIDLRGDIVDGGEGGITGKMRFPISNPTRNIDKYPPISYIMSENTKERENSFSILAEQIRPRG